MPTRKSKKKTTRKTRASRKRVHELKIPKQDVKRPAHRGESSRASRNMSITQLQNLAKARGIPFGGLSKTQLVNKINRY